MAWGKDYVGLACDGTFHFVIGYDALEVKTAHSGTFEVHETFEILVVTRLAKLGVCDGCWQQAFAIQK